MTRRDDEFYALAVANSYLGEHRTFNGKLMQDLRGKRGLNYGDYSYDELRDILTSGKPSPITYDTRGTPENILAEDKQIAAFPLENVTVKIVPVERMFEE